LADVNKAVKSSRLTQVALAEKLACSPQHVCDLLGGRRRLSPKIINAIGKAVAVHPVRWRQWHHLGAKAAGWNLA
jgi:DNA-binding transcriptional regulator YdaS (Cro superfamily)